MSLATPPTRPEPPTMPPAPTDHLQSNAAPPNPIHTSDPPNIPNGTVQNPQQPLQTPRESAAQSEITPLVIPDATSNAAQANPGQHSLEPTTAQAATATPTKRQKPKSASKPSPWHKLRDNMSRMLHTRQARQWVTAALNATSHEVCSPPEDAVAGVLEALLKGGNTADRSTPVGAVLSLLRERMKSSSWVVVLKTEIVFHAIFRGGNQRFVDFMANETRDTFDLDHFEDKSPAGVVHSPLVRAYAWYLKRWLIMRKSASFPQTNSSDAAVTQRFRASETQDLLSALPMVLDTIEVLQQFPVTQEVTNSPVAKPGLLMVLHDQLIFFAALGSGFSRLVDLFFTMSPEQAVPARGLYTRFLAVIAAALPVIEQIRTIDTRWQVPTLSFPADMVSQMQQYIDGGCEHTVETEWSIACRRATTASNEPASAADIAAVVKWQHTGEPADPQTPIGGIVSFITSRLREADWRVVLKTQILMRNLLSRAGVPLLMHLDYHAKEIFEGSALSVSNDSPEAAAHIPLIAWFSDFLQIRTGVLHTAAVQRANKSFGDAEKLIASLPRGLDVLDMLQSFYVSDETRLSPLAKAAYQVILSEISKVFAAVVRKANDLVGMFFEFEPRTAASGLVVYERFVTLFKSVDDPGNMFERAKIVDPSWRRPEEVVVSTDILADMRMFVANSAPSSSMDPGIATRLAGPSGSSNGSAAWPQNQGTQDVLI